MKRLFIIIIVFFCLQLTEINAQVKLYTSSEQDGEAFEISFGSNALPETHFNPKSIQVDQGAVVVLFEKFVDGKTSGRHRIITHSDAALYLGFKVSHAIVFSNPEGNVILFEDTNLSGRTIEVKHYKTVVPDDFGVSSIYVPKGKKVKLYTIDPALYPDQEVDHRPISSGIRPHIGTDIEDKVKIVILE